MVLPPIYELLERLSNLVRAEEREAGARDGLPPAQLSALLYLSRCNRYSDTPAAVTDYLGVTKGTASQTLMSLEKRGLVEKTADAIDGRVTHLRLTLTGRAIVEESLPPEALNLAIGKLTKPKAAKIEASLRELLAELLRTRDGRSFGVCCTCRHFQTEDQRFRCGLTQEPLQPAESLQICREHSSS